VRIRDLACGVQVVQLMGAMAMPETDSVSAPLAGRVLIADDQKHVLEALEFLLKDCGFCTHAVTDPQHALTALAGDRFDAVLVDLNYTRDTTSGTEGLELVSRIRSIDETVPVLVMTAWGSVDQAVEAMRRGASDFVQKPWDNRELLHKLQNQLSIAAAQRRTQWERSHELEEAREIQDKLLPKRLPELPGYEVAGTTRPIRVVGGDYYNVVRISREEIAFCIADVAGKGMPAALLMSSLQAALMPLVEQRLGPCELCRRLNRMLCDLTPVGKFISFFYAVLNSSNRRLTYCNAGHNPPLLVRADGEWTELNAAGAVLGQFPDWQYEQSELTMDVGDKLVVFTDGLVESTDVDDEPFGEQNVIRIAQENPNACAQELMSSLIEAASKHCDGHFQDDASLMVLKAVSDRPSAIEAHAVQPETIA
jgi:phosphoserine phosphatase RsbU/P